MRPTTRRARALDFFVEPATAPPRGAPPAAAQRAVAPPRRAPRAAPASHVRHGAYLAPSARPGPDVRPLAATRMPLRAAVLGSPGGAVPVGALLANAMRSAAGASAAGLAVWAPGAGAVVHGGPASFAAARLAARLSARGLPAVRRGRLAWMALEEHPVAAAVAARRASAALEVPLVVVLAAARCEVVEGLLAEQDLVVVATAEPDGPLARLAVASCAAAALACPPPGAGPARWLAGTGALGGRALSAPLRALVGEIAAPPPGPGTTEAAW